MKIIFIYFIPRKRFINKEQDLKIRISKERERERVRERKRLFLDRFQ